MLTRLYSKPGTLPEGLAPTLNTCDIESICSNVTVEAAEAGPMKMEGEKTREMGIYLSRLPVFVNHRGIPRGEEGLGAAEMVSAADEKH